MGDTTTMIEFPAIGATYRRDEYGVYRYDTYPESSVLAGQERRTFLDSFKSLETAQSRYPDAVWVGNVSGYREHVVPVEPPQWFDPLEAGESWDGE